MSLFCTKSYYFIRTVYLWTCQIDFTKWQYVSKDKNKNAGASGRCLCVCVCVCVFECAQNGSSFMSYY